MANRYFATHFGDKSFISNENGLHRAFEWLTDSLANAAAADLPSRLPEGGTPDTDVLDRLAPYVLDAATPLDAPETLAHMDPPTPTCCMRKPRRSSARPKSGSSLGWRLISAWTAAT
jgi:hypothetical protein